MRKFLIERTVPGIQNMPESDRRKVWAKSNAVLAELAPDLQWAHSYVTDDKLYCVYYTSDPELIREHARRGGFPCDSIMPIDDIVDPTRAG
ncbi:DUF4242 domain-containing protein [Pseudonocardia asaccharolytica]|uniref:DUF4242 domain-containing protein n=1 Tax=Pseudonocardia asaccharolytica DSM 44247 = NBRC 16224 TaxID=1123024 RepID=A0A511D306_9PSEU|nr:DUF4242 domain-containing protein [Pseudonocardia asaccharolytica]GEL17964.1 hypothetical protein PA7_18010 [Pseudonocardia asaccharolytica DSM 44247 = NBRC 16224]